METLDGKNILITGGAHRIGKALSLAVAKAGGNVILHYGSSEEQAIETKEIIEELNSNAFLLKANLADKSEVEQIIPRALAFGPIYGLINNAAIFAPINLAQTTTSEWQKHLDINLTAPFILSQAFINTLNTNEHGRIINILDWRAARPQSDHFPYTISKAGLMALTYGLASSVGPNITVNGIALGAILPPSDGANSIDIVQNIPARRWAKIEEVQETLIFLLTGPEYITGEIIHVDGGRHLI